MYVFAPKPESVVLEFIQILALMAEAVNIGSPYTETVLMAMFVQPEIAFIPITE